MFELIAASILIISIFGIAVIIFRKIPMFLELPETAPAQFDWEELLMKIRNLSPFKNFPSEIFLQKILSKIRILTLKTDNKTSNWLQKLREKAKKNKFGEDDNYWQKIKKSTKK